MNTIWSEQVQGIKCLDLSRELRFRDDRKDLFLDVLGITPKMTVVDIGCGPGTFTRKLSKWLGDEAKIIGIDRDHNFIQYARERAQKEQNSSLQYIEGEALNLPISDRSVDVCVSHTVIEHIPNKEFILEQKRVCKKNGRVCIMFSRPDKYIQTEPDSLPKITNREKELMTQLFKDTPSIDDKYNIGKFWPDPVELPKLFEELGFKDIEIDAIAIPIVIDDSRLTIKDKILIVENEKSQLLESVELNLKHNSLTKAEELELKRLIDERFNKRINMIKSESRLWDYTITLTQVVSGIVE